MRKSFKQQCIVLEQSCVNTITEFMPEKGLKEMDISSSKICGRVGKLTLTTEMDETGYPNQVVRFYSKKKNTPLYYVSLEELCSITDYIIESADSAR